MRALFLSLLWFMAISTTVTAQQDFYYDVDTSGTPSVEIGEILHDDVIDEPTGFVQRLLEIFGLDIYASGTNPDTWETLGATNYIRAVINIAIALAGLIALLVLIYGFGQMLFTSEEEWFAKAKKYVIWAAIAIGLLWLSWFIVSFIFSIYSAVRL